MTIGIVPNGIKVELNAIQNGIPVVNRFYVTKSSAPTEDDLGDAVVAAKAFFDAYKNMCHTSYVLQNITATDVHVANGPQVIVPYTTGNTGTDTGGQLPANAAIVASLRTNFTGRSFRGRFYLGGLSNITLQDAQHCTTGAATHLASCFSDFIDALNAINMTLVVVSNYAAKVVRVVALATEIISVIVDTKYDSQRRRTAN